MIPVTYLPRQKLGFRRAREGVISCTLETRPGINLIASKTILVINQDGDTNADDDNLSLNLLLLYEVSKI